MWGRKEKEEGEHKEEKEEDKGNNSSEDYILDTNPRHIEGKTKKL